MQYYTKKNNNKNCSKSTKNKLNFQSAVSSAATKTQNNHQYYTIYVKRKKVLNYANVLQSHVKKCQKFRIVALKFVRFQFVLA